MQHSWHAAHRIDGLQTASFEAVATSLLHSGGHKQAQRASELHSRTELNKARIAALQAIPRQPGSTARLSKKPLQTGLTPEVQKALRGLHTVDGHATPASSSAHKASSAPKDAALLSRSQARDASTAPKVAATTGISQEVVVKKQPGNGLQTVAPAVKPGATGSQRQAASGPARKTIDKIAADRQDSNRRDRSAGPQPSTSRQASKRRRSRSRSQSTARGVDSQASKGRVDASRRLDNSSHRHRTR